MAASLDGVFDANLQKKILESKIFVVGAGGIGCELLKNLVLVGFQNIEIIDLDTIDVSNLNRQFLFRKQHVGKSKAAVATESALQFNPNVKIKYYHESVIGNNFNVDFFGKFDIVLNALDNLAARNHVNRMCLAAGIPLLESGTAGYIGQVELIKKGLTQCYECEMKRGQKTYPSCTIRNTPTEPIHCIIWAKHLFNQLFGEADADEDVSPNTEDPEIDSNTVAQMKKQNGVCIQKSTRAWAEESGYDPNKLLRKVFNDDIRYLLTMEKLWVTRTSPEPLDINNLPDAVPGSSKQEKEAGIKDMTMWSIAECVQVFKDSVIALKKEKESHGEGTNLVWDKDDKYAMDFVAASANLRAYVFHIAQNTRFEIKSMAGNIIPAIATTNAIIAGVVVLRAFNVLRELYTDCSSVYLRMKPNHVGHLLVPEKGLNPPNPKCFICAPNPQVVVECDIGKMTIKVFEEDVLKKALNMAAPDAILQSTSTLIISSEEGETGNSDSLLSDVGFYDGAILKVDDFLQNYELTVIIKQFEAAIDQPLFNIHTGGVELGPKPVEETAANKAEDEDEIEMMECTDENTSTKRKFEGREQSLSPPKKRPRAKMEEEIEIL